MTREKAIETIKEAYGNTEYTDRIIQALEQEAYENNICDSCHTKGCIFQSGIKRVNCEFYTAQNEPCNDAISRESLLNKLCGYHVDIEKPIFDKLWRVIKDMPTVTPQEPKAWMPLPQPYKAESEE